MPRKIFELAKELNIGPLDLVEDLKQKGYEVRNHMSSLEDEMIEKIIADYAAEEAEKAQLAKSKKKKTKRKTAKKKTAKKKAVGSKVKAKTGDAEAEKPVKKKTKRKVVRRKAGSKEIIKEEEAVVENNEALANEAASESTETSVAAETLSPEEVQAPSKVDDSPTGLRVISAPDPKEVAANEKKKKEEQELYKEKTHKFTPVFTPEASEGGDDQDKKDSKKRLGGLATMMSGKKNPINRSQTLNQSRADSELKSYAALSGSGRPIYTQVKRKRIFSGASKSTEITEVKDSKRIVKLHGGAKAVVLAKKLAVKLKELVDQCLEINLLIKGEDYIGLELAADIAAMYEFRVENVAFDEDKVLEKEELTAEQKEKLPLRDPVIAIMGHVDHGKTSLLDYIRNEKVAAAEAGGITQHIGAYKVKVNDKMSLAFLDTPGHAAFASMRQRGADATDIVVLVVAADDGVMPQTKESIKFIQQSGNPMIVAINKMDKEGVNPDKVKQELAEFNIAPEEWGGDTMMCPISALKGDGVDALLESIALQAEVMELRADPKGKAEGIVIESKIEQGRGPVATVLIQKGTLKKGDSIVVGESFGRARGLTDHRGTQLKSAGPSTPIQILGLDQPPSPGDILNIVKSEREAKKIVENRITDRKKLESTVKKKTVSLEDFFGAAASEEGEAKSLNLVIRSDVQGSFEAIKQALEPLSNSEVEVKIIGGGVGAISDSDVQLADSASGFIIGFNMRPVTSARRLAEDKGVDVKTYSIIYELINDVTLAVEGLLDPDLIEEYIGRAEVKDTFVVPKIGTIAGSIVIDGNIKVGCQVRLLREGRIIFDGKMSSLKRFKDNVKEVKNGYECGVGLEGYNDIKVGDTFEAYLMQEKKRTLKDVLAKDAE